MSLLKNLIHRLLDLPPTRTFELDEGLAHSLRLLADKHGHPLDEVTKSVITCGIEHYYSNDACWERWQSLTPREHEVMGLVITGMLNKQVAMRLGITEATVKLHRAHVMEKIGVKSVAELVQLNERAAMSLGQSR